MDYKFLQENTPLPREVENVLQGEKLLRKEQQTRSYSTLHSRVLGVVG